MAKKSASKKKPVRSKAKPSAKKAAKKNSKPSTKKAKAKPAAKKVKKKAAPKPARKAAAKKAAVKKPVRKVVAKKAPAKKPAPKPARKATAGPSKPVGSILSFFKKPAPAPAAPKPAPAPAPKAAAPPAAATAATPNTPAGWEFIETRDNHYFDASTHHMATRKAPIYKLTGQNGFFFRATMNVDADGAPKCYHPTDNSKALDDLSNSTSNSRQFIQGQNGVGPAPGFYVSQTSLQFSSSQAHRCDNFVDAVEIPYVVMPGGFHGLQLGDCGVVYNRSNGRLTHVIFADTNPRVGEASVKTAHNLGFANATPRNGIDDAIFVYLVFPGTRFTPLAAAPHWPDATIKQVAEAAFEAWGGLARMRDVASKL